MTEAKQKGKQSIACMIEIDKHDHCSISDNNDKLILDDFVWLLFALDDMLWLTGDRFFLVVLRPVLPNWVKKKSCLI
jgi:hypothetical protein